MKKTFLLLLVGIMLVSLIACQPSEIPSATELVPFSPPQKTAEAGSFQADMYFISKDTSELSCEVMEIQAYNDQSTLDAMVNRLMKAPKYDYHRNPINPSYKLTDIEVSEGVANVFFEGDEFNSNSSAAIKQYLETQAVILASLEMFGINTINIYVNGVAISYNDSPVGFSTKHTGELSDYISKTTRDFNNYKNLSVDSPYTSNCIMYVKDFSGYYLANKQRIVIKNEATKEELVRVVFERFISLYNEFAHYNIVLDNVVIDEHLGSQNATLQIGGEFPDEILDTLMTGLCLTLTGYIPDLHYVTVNHNESSQIMQRKNFADKIGNKTKVYYPYLVSDVLNVRHITISKGLACCYLSDYVSKYFESSVENGNLFRGMSEDFIIDVYASNGIAVLNLKQDFYDMFDTYINNENSIVDGDVSERLVIYGIVNSLTEVNFIDSVLFLCEGENVGVIKNLYLGSPLYKNIGLVFGT